MEASYDIMSRTEPGNDQIASPKERLKRCEIDADNVRYPYCMVWTPLPLISWILPMIGHTGICTSEGVIHDFGGPYYVAVDDMTFGNPTKYIPLQLDETNIDDWDRYVERGDKAYGQMMHNLCCNNCHSHCAYVLNQAKYKGNTGYTMIHIWWMFMIRSKYVGFSVSFIDHYQFIGIHQIIYWIHGHTYDSCFTILFN